jgi:hypothetical protein
MADMDLYGKTWNAVRDLLEELEEPEAMVAMLEGQLASVLDVHYSEEIHARILIDVMSNVITLIEEVNEESDKEKDEDCDKNATA